MVEPSSRQLSSQGKQQVPVAEGLFAWPSTEPCLIGSKCQHCGEAFFPAQMACGFCSSTDMEEVTFSRRGTLDYYTCSRYPTPGYMGALPLCIGFIRLPEGTKIIAPLTDENIESLEMGMEMEMVVRPVATDDEGNDLIGFAFRPV